MTSLSPEYQHLFDRLLEAVSRQPMYASQSLTAFWPMCGHQYTGGLMVIGRAVNGWYEGWDVSQATNASGRQTILARTEGISVVEERCPMLWVTNSWGSKDHYNTNRSAFWRVIKQVALSEGGSKEDASWSSRICWSNLYEVSPAQGGNPSGPAMRAQFPLSAAMIAQELEAFAPKCVLTLAGRGWFEPFAKRLNIAVQWRQGLVQGTAVQGERRWVIAQHPMGKPEKAMIADVIQAFRQGE